MPRLGVPRRAATPDTGAPVTMLELFFDLVFVFTVTRLTIVVANTHGALGFLEAATILFVVWRMYDGYCWLSNNISPTATSTRLPMLLAMGAFLVLAIALPEAYGEDRWLFAWAYLGIVLMHAVSFLRSSLGGSGRAVLAIAPVNLGAASLLFVAAALPAGVRWIAWLGAVGVYAASMLSQPETRYSIPRVHFAERHRLLLIIALGESVIAVGASAEGHISEVRYTIAVLLGMLLIALFWWVHFADEERTTEALLRVEGSDPNRLVYVALLAYSMSYLVLVAGLIPVAAGLHMVVLDPGQQLTLLSASLLGVGTAIYLVGNALHLWLLDLSIGWPLKVAAVLALVTVPIGRVVSGDAQVIMLSVILAAALAVSSMAASPAPWVATPTEGR